MSGPIKNDRRVILVGTVETLRGAARLLEGIASDEAEVLGAVVLTADELGAARERNELPWPVLGTAEDLARLHGRFGFGAAVVSIPGVMGAAMGRVSTALSALGVEERVLPSIHDVLNGGASTMGHDTALGRAVFGGSSAGGGAAGMDFARLIGRPARALDHEAAGRALRGKRVLITGAGGSIGSELARLCASVEPETLILMERGENALFEIDREIGARFPGVARRAVLHDVTDTEGTLRRLVSLRPAVVFHAAAHKHVPMMEDHPSAAVTNNLFGTKSIADAALAVGAERFVMVSTDKAVNPSSVMGATKRMAELYVRSLNGSRGGNGQANGTNGGTHFSLVRFGNVLGSACSVLPIWAGQVSEGGPVTVTHPEMTRFFMTIPEAATLVIHAGTLGADPRTGRRHEVFILDMGEPVRIVELAERFVRALGATPRFPDGFAGRGGPSVGPAVRVVFSGIRPGEKLHEELAYAAEELRPTEAAGVMAWVGELTERIDPAYITQMIAEMSAMKSVQDADMVIRAIGNYVQIQNKQSTILPSRGEAA
ncbi:MAG TPA: polysaccharide biosynthesis protein [Phycisphaerales bacterium]|nr:polysaccharide biosynthesis protein [Phycisphaerales bacterium]